jgi:hypothetical protein
MPDDYPAQLRRQFIVAAAVIGGIMLALLVLHLQRL